MAGGIAEPGIVSGTRWQARVQRGSATADLRRMHATASSGDEQAHDVVEAEGGRVVASQDRDAATELGLAEFVYEFVNLCPGSRIDVEQHLGHLLGVYASCTELRR